MPSVTLAEFIQSQVTSAVSKVDLRTKIGEAINSLNAFATALDTQLATAPIQFAAQDPDYAAFVEALPTPAIPE
jgi:hypothetical protein